MQHRAVSTDTKPDDAELQRCRQIRSPMDIAGFANARRRERSVVALSLAEAAASSLLKVMDAPVIPAVCRIDGLKQIPSVICMQLKVHLLEFQECASTALTSLIWSIGVSSYRIRFIRWRLCLSCA